MNDAQEKSPITPKHLWVVGVVGALWSSVGAMDYLMTQTQNEGYMAQFTPEQLEFFYGFPIWVTAAWAFAVWGGVLGSILLLMRKGIAVPVFLTSLVGLIITSFHNFVLSNGLEIMGDAFPLIINVLVFVTAIALFVYARAMKRQGVLS